MYLFRFCYPCDSTIFYSTPEAAEQAIANLNHSDFHGRKVHLRIDRDNLEPDPPGTSVVSVGTLPWVSTDLQLQELFVDFKPFSCRVMRDMYGRSRGFAILKFHTAEDSIAAIEAMHLFELNGRALEVNSSYIVVLEGRYSAYMSLNLALHFHALTLCISLSLL